MIYQSLYHISKMGLDRYLAVSPFSKALVNIIPSFSFSFSWTNSNYEITHVYDESNQWPDVAFDYHTKYCNKFSKDAHPNLVQWHKESSSVVNSKDFYFDDYYSSSTYTDIWSKLDYHHTLIASVKINNSPIGLLKLHRRQYEPPYNEQDKNKLEDALPLIAEGLSCNKCQKQTSLLKTDVFGVVIVDENNQHRYISPTANKLLYLCGSAQAIKANRAISISDVNDEFQRLYGLCEKLSNNKKSHSIGHIETEYVTNCWGGFTFVASWLQAPENGHAGMICINIQLHEPSHVKTLRRCESHSFTFRQIQICMLLCQSKTFDEIADELHISTHTVIDHMKKVYNKLSVVSRNEVVKQLLYA